MQTIHVAKPARTRAANGRRLAALTAILAVLMLLIAACTDDATADSSPDTDETTEAATPADADIEADNGPESLTLCFASSIDQVGRGNLDGGVAGFDECLADDYVFEFQSFPGGPSVVCPGEGCPVQGFSSLGEMRAVFADSFFVASGYLATQHQVLNIDVDRSGDSAEVTAYIQAQHFLPDNSVDIAWNDYAYTAVLDNGEWKMATETIVGTAFLNFQGEIVGSGDDGSSDDQDNAAGDGPLASAGEVTLRNTLQDPGEPEVTYASLFGQADDAFDEFASLSTTDVEFPTALAQDGTAAGDISGLYRIDVSGNAIEFAVLADADDPFWSNVFGLFPEGKVDRYYFTFNQPHNVAGFSSDNPDLNVRIDSDTVLVVELTAGYDLQPGVSFTIDLMS
ncbi:MAG: nuclear transport factor 2 family protein [Actinomycetota bacterium]